MGSKALQGCGTALLPGACRDSVGWVGSFSPRAAETSSPSLHPRDRLLHRASPAAPREGGWLLGGGSSPFLELRDVPGSPGRSARLGAGAKRNRLRHGEQQKSAAPL